MADQDSLVLNDGHSTSIVEALTSGPDSDLAMQASYTPQLSYGYYSPYIASVLDIAKILDSFHTAQYQYIPALASPHGKDLHLTLNTAPSFHNPKSVLVVALPAVERAQLPPLHAVDPKEIYCARKTALVLPVEGAPLVFSTAYAHDMTLSLTGSRRQDARSAGDRGRRSRRLRGRYLGARQAQRSATACGLRCKATGDSTRTAVRPFSCATPAPRPGSWRRATRQRSSWDGRTRCICAPTV